jgi:hypothetical protein
LRQQFLNVEYTPLLVAFVIEEGLMRLPRTQDDGNLSLVEYIDEIETSPYAILSHRWGADNEEVTFQEIEQKIGTKKTGYDKTTACANQAKEDRLEFIWIDTCCIRDVAQKTISYESGGCCRQKRWAWKFWTSNSVSYRTVAYSAPSFLLKLVTVTF